jgi:hypothetical protein
MTMKMISCAGCDRPILDQYLYNVLDRAWHQACIQCSDCKSNLNEKCYSRDGKLYCKEDFYRRYGPKCAGCDQPILPSDLVRREHQHRQTTTATISNILNNNDSGKIFHLNCFMCCSCRKPITTGEQLYIVDDNKFMCKQDYFTFKQQHRQGKTKI